MDFELPILAPSLLAANFSNLGSQIDECLKADIQWLHADVMDGHFVPNISYGPDILKTIDTCAPDAFLDVHLMIENPDLFIEDYVNAGADLISIHQEASRHLHRSVQLIKKYEILAGVALNPATPFSALHPIAEELDLVLLMSVNPGFGGQSFIEQTYRKIEEVAEFREKNGLAFLIEIDGGVGLKNIQQIVASGADVLVAGSSVFKTDSIPGRIEELRKLANRGT